MNRSWRVIKSVGGYGHTVNVVVRDRKLYVRWWDAVQRKQAWQSLGHSNRALAERQARELAAELLSSVEAEQTGELFLGELFARYNQDVTRHRERTQREEDRRRMDVWEAAVGANRDVRTLCDQDMSTFVRIRRDGTLSVPWKRFEGVTPPAVQRSLSKCVTDTTIGADIVFLHAVLNWATRVRGANGKRLLSENPVRGYATPKNRNPNRPVATYDRFLKVREHADAADSQNRFGVFMDLVESLGWRVSAICQLRAEDVDRKAYPDAPHGRILKRGEVDKEGVEMWVPLSEDARRALDRLPVVRGWLFPAPKNVQEPWSRFHARDLYERAEKLANLEPLKGSDFHAYRRKWATERKHLPDADVMAAGGWRDPRSLKEAYQRVDPKTLLAVVSEKRKLRESK